MLLVFAHPDDETVALGARLSRFEAAHLVHVTDGAPRNEYDSRRYGFPSWREYRQARQNELSATLARAGIAAISRECLEIPDQQASLALPWITRNLAAIIQSLEPEVVFTHPFRGGHPDHDACAFAVHHAVDSLKARGSLTPLIAEAAFYNAGRTRVLPISCPMPKNTVAIEYRLTPEEKATKQALLDCFTTQRETLRDWPMEGERFRIAPSYDFSNPPHRPPVWYDRYPWGMTSRYFCELAQQAQWSLHDKGVVQ